MPVAAAEKGAESASIGARRILVTGGTGFVGTAIITALAEQHSEYDLSVLDIEPLRPEILEAFDVRFFAANITKSEEVLKAVKAAKPDIIVHTAGYVPTGQARYGQRQRELCLKVNVDGTQNMLAAAKRFGVRQLVYTSSITAITDDTDHDHPNLNEGVPLGSANLIYGESKGIAERLVLEANSMDLQTCALRPSTIFGKGDYNLVPAIHACIAKGETPFIIGTGLNLFDFSYVSNIADAHVLAVENLLGSSTAAGRTFFITNGQPVPFRAFCLAVWAHFDHYPPYQVRIPKRLAWFAGFCSEIATMVTGKPATLSRGSVKDACQTAYANVDAARSILGYEPRVSLVDGLKVACEDLKRRLDGEELPPKAPNALSYNYLS